VSAVTQKRATPWNSERATNPDWKWQPYAVTDRRMWLGRPVSTPQEAMALAQALKVRVARTRQELIVIGVTRMEDTKAS